MFTGIIQGTAEVISITRREAFQTHLIRMPEAAIEGLAPGASVAHNGCCLTVTSINGTDVSFDLMQETLRTTNLGQLQPGDRINFERAARFGDEIGGHQMSGHIICTAEVVERNSSTDNLQLLIQLPDSFHKYIFSKGYIGIDGISLTVGQHAAGRFDVNLIPETLQRTTLGQRMPGDRVNIEIDPQTQTIVDTVERVLADRSF